jgi:hypothetical protein
MSWCLISDAQLWFPDEGMAKQRDDRGQMRHLGQWTLSRNPLNFPTQYNALGLELSFTLDSASEAELHKGSGFLEHSLASYDVTNICFAIMFDMQ